MGLIIPDPRDQARTRPVLMVQADFGPVVGLRLVLVTCSLR
jgi:hypothetical protein